MRIEVFIQRTQELAFKTRQNAQWLIALGAALLCLLGAIPSGAQDQGAYSFVLLADQPGTFFDLERLGRSSINNAGTVAFLDRSQGIRVVGDRKSALIATNEEFGFGNLAAINDAGHVAFFVTERCQQFPCPRGIIVGDERKLTFAVEDFSFTGIVDPTLNNQGTVAFAVPPGDVFTVGPKGTQLLAEFGFGPDSAGGSVVIADSGLVVFPKFPAPNRLALYLHDGRELRSLLEVDSSDGTRILSLDVNSKGLVVFSVGNPSVVGDIGCICGIADT